MGFFFEIECAPGIAILMGQFNDKPLDIYTYIHIGVPYFQTNSFLVRCCPVFHGDFSNMGITGSQSFPVYDGDLTHHCFFFDVYVIH
jgi:hypothetical protein